MNDAPTYFITWTTYGTWLPGDARGWRKIKKGTQTPRPKLEAWTRRQLSETHVTLTEAQRRSVEAVCRKHAGLRNWILHAINARSNHVHLVTTADQEPEIVRDQFKAYATRALRSASVGSTQKKQKKIWTRGGDVEFVDGEENLERVIQYVTEAQDRMDLEFRTAWRKPLNPSG